MVVVFLGDVSFIDQKIKSSVYTAVSQNEKNRNTQKTLIKRSKSIKASLDHLPPIVSELDVCEINGFVSSPTPNQFD